MYLKKYHPQFKKLTQKEKRAHSHSPPLSIFWGLLIKIWLWIKNLHLSISAQLLSRANFHNADASRPRKRLGTANSLNRSVFELLHIAGTEFVSGACLLHAQPLLPPGCMRRSLLSLLIIKPDVVSTRLVWLSSSAILSILPASSW